jgi:16S rRNA (uracil1498-N3)-methyltransferase
MSRRRFFCANIPQPGEFACLNEDDSRHALKVLRLKDGDDLDLLDGGGCLASAVVAGVLGSRHSPTLQCRILERTELPPPRVKLRLFVAPPRAKLMAAVIRQATELGVWRISPIFCERSVALPAEVEKMRGWQAEAVAALKQSGNLFLPVLDPPCEFGKTLEAGCELGIYGEPEEAGEQNNADWAQFTGELGIWIGPEGGFSPEERAALKTSGVRAVRIGQWTLRVETAVPAMLGWLMGRLQHD